MVEKKDKSIVLQVKRKNTRHHQSKKEILYPEQHPQ